MTMMTTNPSIRQLVKQELGKVTQFCIYAVFEWVLIALLFINGFLSFVATQFAKYCELRIPCLLCSRIDHLCAERDEDFHYNETMCEIHRRDVSYLAYCHNHKKLSDIRKMCEACLLSFATEKESDGDTYKSLVGILHKDLECFVEDDNQIHLSLGKNTDHKLQVERSSVHKCSCCGMHLKLKNVDKGKNRNQTVATAPAPPPPPQPPVEDLEENQTPFEDSKTNLPFGDGEETPRFIRGNKFFGMTVSDSGATSPRWASGKVFAKKSPLERVEFGSESEGRVANEADESILHRLKRQVRLDRKSLMSLYMELDEERNASAVAANNAMAMITRLQADKAAVQMEALQYQRMMEEQAEYDQEALQETQKIIRDMENELEAYRHKFGELEIDKDPGVDCLDMRSQSPSNTPNLSTLEGLELEKDDNIVISSSISESSSTGSVDQVITDNFEGSGDIEDESKKDEVVTDDLEGSGHLEDEEVIAYNLDGSGHLEDESRKEEVVRDGREEEREVSRVLDNSLRIFEGERSEILDQIKNLEDQFEFEEDDDSDPFASSKSSSDIENNTHAQEETEKAGNKGGLARELSFLNERVHNLEAHSGFLKDAAKTLQKGGDGAQLLGEISENLQKLRQLMSMSRDKEDPDRRLVNPENDIRLLNPKN